MSLDVATCLETLVAELAGEGTLASMLAEVDYKRREGFV